MFCRLRSTVSEVYPMAKKKGEIREIIRIVCTEDGKSYYTTTKNKRTTPEKMSIMKFDPKVRKHVEYKETKIK